MTGAPMSGAFYQALAPYYDTLLDGPDYEAWAGFFARAAAQTGQRDIKHVLDLACGTGNMTLPLLRRGYEVTGLDLSPDMLAEAQRRSREEGYQPLFLCRDMCEPEKCGDFDAVICCLDGINYITSPGKLDQCFAGAAASLNPGGVFFFDVNTPYKFETLYGENDYILEDEGVLCAWSNQYNRRSRLAHMQLTLFTEEADGRWRRRDEYHTERCYTAAVLRRHLEAAGFTDIAMYGGFDFAPPADTDERMYIVCRKD